VNVGITGSIEEDREGDASTKRTLYQNNQTKRVDVNDLIDGGIVRNDYFTPATAEGALNVSKAKLEPGTSILLINEDCIVDVNCNSKEDECLLRQHSLIQASALYQPFGDLEQIFFDFENEPSGIFCSLSYVNCRNEKLPGSFCSYSGINGNNGNEWEPLSEGVLSLNNDSGEMVEFAQKYFNAHVIPGRRGRAGGIKNTISKTVNYLTRKTINVRQLIPCKISLNFFFFFKIIYNHFFKNNILIKILKTLNIFHLKHYSLKLFKLSVDVTSTKQTVYLV